MSEVNIHISVVESIGQIASEAWDALWQHGYPFTRHAFLACLENTGVTTDETGWIPQHFVAFRDGAPIAALPCFLKYHSYGEYVFDWSWADAYQQAGREYYPKLLNAIPFTPATGQRIGWLATLNETERAAVFLKLWEYIQHYCERHNVSGFHSLFPSPEAQALYSQTALQRRYGNQFHWFNQGYDSFNQFLEAFNSRKRKALKRERRKVEENAIAIQMRPGKEVSTEDWSLFFALYHRTYLKNSGRYGYLNRDFFTELPKALPDNVMLATASRDNKMLAGALYFKDDTTLYGRYWGTKADIDGLHFETCYYQGIEYAIANKLQRFDPGAQGEHKIQRGFTPVTTCSYHWLKDSDFNLAVSRFLQEEKTYVQRYIDEARTFLPFKEGAFIQDANIYLADR